MSFDAFASCLSARGLPDEADVVVVLRNTKVDVAVERLTPALELCVQFRAPLCMPFEANTYEEALWVREVVSELGWHEVVLVTHAAHQYRAFLTFVKVFAGLDTELYVFPVGEGALSLVEERAKIPRYQNLGHVASYEEGIRTCLSSLIRR